VITLGVVGLFRMPDAYTQLHAAGKAVFLGLVALLIASLATRDASIAARAALIAVFLILTTPVGAHVIARAAYQRREGMLTPGAIDESGSGAPERGPDEPRGEPPPTIPR
jgi:multicomponent Na+:H+ antiporter subunit G